MALDTQGYVLGDWLKWEQDNLFSRVAITLLAGSGDLSTGTVLGKVTASGSYVQLDPDASDGSQNAAGILLLDRDVPDSSDDADAVAIVRDAIVGDAGLTWPTGISDEDKATAQAALLALGIVTREDA